MLPRKKMENVRLENIAGVCSEDEDESGSRNFGSQKRSECGKSCQVKDETDQSCEDLGEGHSGQREPRIIILL